MDTSLFINRETYHNVYSKEKLTATQIKVKQAAQCNTLAQYRFFNLVIR